MKNNYDLVMDSEENALSPLPPAQRFQVMIYLALMWTTIFCAAFGAWYWYGYLVVGHVLVVLGLAVTGWVFHTSRIMAGRD